jgi:prepilin-type N-terminal cleavage/methylation domain-containing protein
MYFLKKKKTNHKKGFTLIEILVAVGIFGMVMMVGVAALLSLVNASRKAQAIKSVMNNLNFALDNMTRNIAVGTTYHCQTNSVPDLNLTSTQDCLNGGVLLAFEPRNGDINNSADQVIYRILGSKIERSTDGGTNFIAITASEVNIQDLKFYVRGTTIGLADGSQPKVLITIKGIAGSTAKTETPFNLEAMVSQRLLDI